MTQKKELTFEAAFQKLEETARRLEAGGLTLEESLALYEEGTRLAHLCGQRLEEAKLRITQLELGLGHGPEASG